MRPNTSFRPIELNLLCNKGGLGDSVARMPAVKYILDNYKHITRVRLIVQDYFVPLAELLLKEHAERLDVHGYSTMKELLAAHPNTPGMMVDSVHHTTLRTHLTDHAFNTLVDIAVDEKHKEYIQVEVGTEYRALYGSYVVLCTGFTSQTREWLPEYINEVARWIRAQGLRVVFLGKSEGRYWESTNGVTEAHFRTEVDYSVGIDLREKTSLIDALQIMGQAHAVVGIDNGLFHLAACTNVPIVFGLTTLKPEHRVPYRPHGARTYLVLPDKELGCRFCQSKMNFVYNFDHRTCYYGDYKCIEQMGAGKFVRELQSALKGE